MIYVPAVAALFCLLAITLLYILMSRAPDPDHADRSARRVVFAVALIFSGMSAWGWSIFFLT
ncbi:hypothetical protein [Nevskia ramosa]|uniref:hypothetical protein n=1 Tax=Nevskia ramosa TaxID=64002 RepID=UPI003D0ACBFF